MNDYNDSEQEASGTEQGIIDDGGYEQAKELAEKHDLEIGLGMEVVYRRADTEAEFVREMAKMSAPTREVEVAVPADVAEAAQRQVDLLAAGSEREIDEEERRELFDERVLENLHLEFDVEYEM